MEGTVALTVVVCCACGVVYAIPTTLDKNLLEKRSSTNTFCPNSHTWHYVGQSAVERERDLHRQIAALKEDKRALDRRLALAKPRAARKPRLVKPEEASA